MAPSTSSSNNSVHHHRQYHYQRQELELSSFSSSGSFPPLFTIPSIWENETGWWTHGAARAARTKEFGYDRTKIWFDRIHIAGFVAPGTHCSMTLTLAWYGGLLLRWKSIKSTRLPIRFSWTHKNYWQRRKKVSILITSFLKFLEKL